MAEACPGSKSLFIALLYFCGGGQATCFWLPRGVTHACGGGSGTTSQRVKHLSSILLEEIGSIRGFEEASIRLLC
jgi:hypothetical protein